MITNFFSKTKPINFLVLSVMLLVIYLISLIFAFNQGISIAYLLKKGLHFLIVIFMLFVLDFVIRKNTLTNDNSYALLFYVLLWGSYPYSFDDSNILAANLFLLLTFRKIYSLRTPLKTREKIFDSGLWVGIATIFYQWSFIYLILLYAAIFLFNKSSRRNLIIPIIGFFTPVFMLYVYLLAIDKLDIFNRLMVLDIDLNITNYFQSNYMYSVVFISIFAAVSILITTRRSLLASQESKSTWVVLLLQLVLSLIIMLLAPLKNGSEFSFLFFPLSILFAIYFQEIQKYWLKEIILYLFIIAYFSVYIF